METLAGVAFVILWGLLWLWTPTDLVLWGKKPEYPEPYRPPVAPPPDLSFVGKIGEAHTPLRPVGSVLIDGEQQTKRSLAEKALRDNPRDVRSLEVLLSLMNNDDDFVQLSGGVRLSRAEVNEWLLSRQSQGE